MSNRNTLTAFNIWVGPDSFLGRATSFQPSEPSITVTDYRGGGLDGPIPLDMGMELGESSIEFGGFEEAAISRFGLIGEDVQIIARGGLKSRGEPDAKQLQITQTGMLSVASQGEWTPGEGSPLTLTMRCHYIKWELANVKILEIDLINMVRFVDGEDRLTSLRQAIGV